MYIDYRCIDSLSLETLCCSSWPTKVVPILNISRLKHVPCLLAKAKPRNLWGEDVHMEKPSRVAKWFASAETICGSLRPYLRTCVAERAHGCGSVGVDACVCVCLCAFCLFCLCLPGRVWLCVSSVCMCVCVSHDPSTSKKLALHCTMHLAGPLVSTNQEWWYLDSQVGSGQTLWVLYAKNARCICCNMFRYALTTKEIRKQTSNIKNSEEKWRKYRKH